MTGGIFHEIRSFFRRYLTPAVRWIIFANVGILLFQYVVLMALGWFEKSMFLFCQIPGKAVFKLQLWRFVTYMFLHGSGMHLLFNMLALWFFGPRLESRWGTGGFFRFYFICGIGAAVVHAVFTLLTGQGGQMMIGASGAIYGVLLAYALYWPDHPVYLYFFIPMKVKYVVLLFGIVEFLNTIGTTGSHVSHITHLGGLLTAFLYLRGWRIFPNLFRGGFFGGGRRRPKRLVKRYYRDSDGRIYIDFDEE